MKPIESNKDSAGDATTWLLTMHENNPEAFTEWLELFERISRSIGKVAYVERSKKPPGDSKYPCALEGGHYYIFRVNRLGGMLLRALRNLPIVEIHEEKGSATHGETTRQSKAASPSETASLSETLISGKTPADAPELRRSPLLDLLFESAMERGFAELLSRSKLNRVNLVRISDILNGYVDQVREQANSSRFREKQKAFVRPPNDNYRWLKSLIDECFVGDHRLIFACLDLDYSQEAGAKSKLFYSQVKKDGQSLRSQLDSNPFEGARVLGYGLNLRYLPDVGYYYRLLLIGEPKNEGPADWLAIEITKIWKGLAGQTSHVCNRLDIPKNRKLACITREEDLAREALDELAFSLTQLDTQIRLKLSPKDHYFFRGIAQQ
jgi:hypothetical protein